ncbi:Cell division protein FtsL [Actinomadura rubteroloni]|uniref:Cell division protein FtsL n=1 Tax=Actinomadura rubteroloni TaxID=1926885 RepID=A0A2P4UG11_9ACTN|nr:hypothetical protein [Actinomadura rubteroloni]POM23997.1 Cell division protein FtsL [Actinomadura rubteroloni]
MTTTTRPPGARDERPRGARGRAAAKARPAARTAARTRPATETRPEPRTEPRTDARTEARVEPRAERAARPTRGSAPRAPFVLLIIGLLGGALVSLLLLNTVLAEDAFTLTRLQRDNKILAQQKQGLEEEIAREEAPESLRKKAEQLGMRQPDTLAWLDADTGRPIGGSMRPVPSAAAAAAGAAGVLGIPGAVVPGDGVPTAPGGAETP